MEEVFYLGGQNPEMTREYTLLYFEEGKIGRYATPYYADAML